MAAKCRDCKRCAELGVTSLMASPMRVLGAALFSWNIGLFMRKCPICRHRKSLHLNRDAAVAE